MPKAFSPRRVDLPEVREALLVPPGIKGLLGGSWVPSKGSMGILEGQAFRDLLFSGSRIHEEV